MTPEQLAHLTPSEREAWEMCQKSTPGPWEVEPKSSPRMVQSTGLMWMNEDVGLLPSWICNCGSYYDAEQKSKVEGNSAFIAHARTALPELLQTVAELRGDMAAAPHGSGCWNGLHGQKCNCWKSKVKV